MNARHELPGSPELSIDAIAELYERLVLANNTECYTHRYDGYDFVARFGLDAAHYLDFPRLITILEFERIVAERGLRAIRMLMVNGGPEGDPELACIESDEIDRIDFEVDPRRHDLHVLEVDRTDYDFVLMSQTLEHLYDPVRALRNLASVMRPGGFLWTSVPTVSFQHSLPAHFSTGFTPIGLVCLCEQVGLTTVEVGQWGNAKYIGCLFDLGIIPGYFDLRPASLRARGPAHVLRALWRLPIRNFLCDGTHNDFTIPVQTWVLAQKPAV